MPHLSLQVLGTFFLTVDGRPVTSFKSDKVRALLVYLAVEAGRAHRRERLAGLLWPDFPDDAARLRLSDTLSNLRRILGDPGSSAPFLIVTPTTLQFDPGSDHWLDMREFERVTQAVVEEPSAAPRADIAALEAAVASYRGPFLEGFSVKDSTLFEEWALLKREQMAQRMASALRGLTALYEDRGDYEAAQRHALRLVQLEPLDEESYRVSMRVLAAAGNRSAALAVYENCRRVLAEEFKVEPDPETAALRNAIHAGLYAPTARSGRKVREKAEPAPRPALLPRDALASHPLVARPPRRTSAPVRLPFVAREDELARLHGFLDEALAGQSRVVFVTGEAGSGKTALMEEFARRAMAAYEDLAVAGGSCSALAGVGDPYLPFRDILRSLSGEVQTQVEGEAVGAGHGERGRSRLTGFAETLVEHGPDLLALFLPAHRLPADLEVRSGRSGGTAHDEAAARAAGLAGRPNAGPIAMGVPAALFEQFTRVLSASAARRPLLLLINDLHWADSGSLNLLFHLGRRLGNSRVMLLCGYRPDDVDLGRDGARHPLEGVVNELEREFGDLKVQLPAAPGRAFVDALLDSQPNDLPESFREGLECRTGGHPLFTLEMLRGLQDRGDLVQDEQGRWVLSTTLDWDRLPSRVEAVLAERVKRLPDQHQLLLEIASVEGEEFTAEIAARLLGVGEEAAAAWLSGLLRRLRLVRPVGFRRAGPRRLSRYRFTHYVLRQYLYSRLDPFDRARLHEAMGRQLESLDREHDVEALVQLAWQFEQAGLADEASAYHLGAGQQAMRMSAYPEAILHLERGLALLATLPQSEERRQREIDLRLPLAIALSATRGWGATERSTAMAGIASTAEQDGASLSAIPLLVMQGDIALSQGDFLGAVRLGEEALAKASTVGSRQGQMLAHGLLGVSGYVTGNVVAARDHLEKTVHLFSREEDGEFVARVGIDPQALALVWLAPTLWILGYGDQARAAAARAIGLAEELRQPVIRATAVNQSLIWHVLAGLPVEFGDDLAFLLQVSEGRNLPSVQTGAEFLDAWRLARAGQTEAGVQQMKAGLDAWRGPGNYGRLPVGGAILAEVCRANGLVDAGLAVVEEMLELCRSKGIGRLVEAELHRLRGAFLPEEAEGCFRRALDIARAQRARAWELRAGTSLARLWQVQGKQAEAYDLLADIYGWFGEGFDTPDLRDAATLLEALRGPEPARAG